MFRLFAQKHYMGIALFCVWISFVVPLSIMTLYIAHARNEVYSNTVYEHQLRQLGARFDSDLSVITSAVQYNSIEHANTVAPDIKQLVVDVDALSPPDDYVAFHTTFRSSVHSLYDTYTALSQGDGYIAQKNLTLTNQFMRSANALYP